MSTVIVERLEKDAAKETIENAHEAFGLNYSQVASMLGVDRRTVLRYRKTKNIPSERVRAQMEKVREIEHLLEEVFNGEILQLKWLYSSVPLLRGRRPVDLLRNGKLDEVLSVLAGLYSGAQI